MKERPQGALALEQVTAPQPGLVDCPWSWDSLHPSAKLGRACGEYDCVHEDSPLVQLRLKRLSRTIAGERSSSNMLLSAPCLLCHSFLPFAWEENHRCFVQSQSESTHVGALFTQRFFLQQGSHLSARVRQDGGWACCWGVDLVPEMEDPQAVSCQGK